MRLCPALLALLSIPCLAGSLQLNPLALDPAQFRVTEFATGLGNPLGAVQLSDAGIGVGTYNSILRFTDSNHDGVADGAGATLFSAPGARLGLLAAGGYYIDSRFDYFNGLPVSSLNLLKPGGAASDALTAVGTLQLSFPAGWVHGTPGIAVRPAPGHAGSYDLVFNVGAQGDHTVSTGRVQLTGLSTASLEGDS